MENVKQKFFAKPFLQSDYRGFLKDVEVRLNDKTQASDPTKREFYQMRTLRTLYLGGFNIESNYQQSFQTNTYFKCNVQLSQCEGTCLSNCYCIFLSFVYLAALVQDTSFLLLVDFNHVLSVEFRTSVSVQDGTN